jgi:organic hydroperoxide reductase OsmC/OhrA
MSHHTAVLDWHQSGPDFRKGQYSRAHTWIFDGGQRVAASSSPTVVPPPWSAAANVDPEEAFVAAIASCHMLWWLSLAAKAGCDVESYRDEAVGEMTRNDAGALWISTVTLHPSIRYGAGAPAPAEAARLHEQAHALCFLANSVKTRIVVAAPTDAPLPAPTAP